MSEVNSSVKHITAFAANSLMFRELSKDIDSKHKTSLFCAKVSPWIHHTFLESLCKHVNIIIFLGQTVIPRKHAVLSVWDIFTGLANSNKNEANMTV